MILTNSRLKAFRRCPQYHQYAYVDLYRPLETSFAIRFGTLLHLALESWWLNRTLFAALRAIENACLNDEFDEFDRIKAEELIRGYDARWAGQSYETIAVEQEFSVPIESGDTLSGKFDAIARRDGRIYIIDHKSTSEDLTLGGDFHRRVCVLDTQVSTYYRAAKALGYDVAGWIHDCILRVPLRPYKAGKTRKADETPEEFRIRIRTAIAEDPERFYARYTIVRTERDETQAEIDLRRTVRHLKIAVEEGSYRNPDACKAYNRTCEFFGVCEGTDNLDNPMSYRRAEREHEELEAT